MSDLTDLKNRLRNDRPVSWEQLPDFSLYMDQILSYMDRQIMRFDKEQTLTSAMVNNYTKSGLVPRADGKKYNREHLAYLTAICILKRVMSTKDMDLLIREELKGRHSVPDGYTVFCESLDKALNLAADEIEERPDEYTSADNAIHFALLSYAFGIVSNYYVSLLRQEYAEQAAKKEAEIRQKQAEKEAKMRQKRQKAKSNSEKNKK